MQVFGELALQYRGLSPDDPLLEPYFALAEELDIPVGVHTGIGPPGTPYLPCCPHFRVALGNPLEVEEVLVRHPRLRLYLMHAGAPSRAEFHNYLRELMHAGFGKRLLFGSDQMFWPEAIGMAVDGIESATFLTESEKRDIFYHNAARFLRIQQP